MSMLLNKAACRSKTERTKTAYDGLFAASSSNRLKLLFLGTLFDVKVLSTIAKIMSRINGSFLHFLESKSLF